MLVSKNKENYRALLQGAAFIRITKSTPSMKTVSVKFRNCWDSFQQKMRKIQKLNFKCCWDFKVIVTCSFSFHVDLKQKLQKLWYKKERFENVKGRKGWLK